MPVHPKEFGACPSRANPPTEEVSACPTTAPRPRAALIFAERDPGPRDRLDAFLMLAGQDFLWRRNGPGADFGEAVRIHEARIGEAPPRPASLPSFGVARRRGAGRREVAVRLAGRFLGWIVGRGRPCRAADRVWRLGDMLPIRLGLSHEAARREPPRPLADAERRVTELARANLLDPGARATGGRAA